MEIQEVKVKRGRTITYEEVKAFGNNLKIIDDLLCSSVVFTSKKFGTSSDIYKELNKQAHSIARLRSILDNHIDSLKIQDIPADADLSELFYGERDLNIAFIKLKKSL